MLRDEWLHWAETKRQNSAETLRAYRREWDTLAKYAEGRGLDMAHLSSKEIRQFMQYASGSEKTAARRWSALNSFHKFLLSRGRPDNPMAVLSRPKVPPGRPRAVLDLEEKIGRVDEPYRSMAQFIHETGVSPAEMRSIDLEVDVGDDQVWVTGRGKDRLVFLTPKARAALRRVRRGLPKGEWPKPRTIQRRLREAEISMRGVRNTVAAELASNGADIGTVQIVMGHDSAASTRVFMDAFAKTPDSSRVRRALEKRGRLTAEDVESAG